MCPVQVPESVIICKSDGRYVLLATTAKLLYSISCEQHTKLGVMTAHQAQCDADSLLFPCCVFAPSSTRVMDSNQLHAYASVSCAAESAFEARSQDIPSDVTVSV